MGWLALALLVLAGALVARAALFAAQLGVQLRQLRKLPSPRLGILGIDSWRDKDHMPMSHTALTDQLGGLYACRIMHIPFVVVTDPALAHEVLGHTRNLPKSAAVFRMFNTLTSPGGRQPNMLGHATNDGYWKLVRKGTAPAFNPQHIRAHFGHVVALGEQLCAVLSNPGPDAWLDVNNLLQREAMDVIGRVGFATDLGAVRRFQPPASGESTGSTGWDSSSCGGGGRGPGAAEGSTGGYGRSAGSRHGSGAGLDPNDLFPIIKEAGEEVGQRLTNPLRFWLRHISPSARRAELQLERFRARMHSLLREIRARGPPAEDDMSVAAHLLRIRDPATGKPLTEEQLAGEIGFFFFAGYETTGNTMAWTLYFLAQHPEAEARLCDELDALGLLATLGRPSPRPLVYEDLAKLTWLGCIIKEAMRLAPAVAAGTMRESPVPIELGGYRIPAGVPLFVAIHAVMNSERYWEGPAEFRPERWLEPGAENWYGSKEGLGSGPSAPAEAGLGAGQGSSDPPRDAGAGLEGTPKRFIPFGSGPRACIGQTLAQMNYTATLAILLSRFTFRLPDELKGPEAFWRLQANRITLQPKHGLPMRCIPRVKGVAG